MASVSSRLDWRIERTELEAITVDSVWPLQYVFSTGPRDAKPEKNQKLRNMITPRWPSYTLVLIAAILGWLIPFGLMRLGQTLRWSSQQKNAKPVVLASNPSSPPISIRFHLAALLFLPFIGMALLGFPLIFSVRTDYSRFSSLILGAIALPMVIALFYCLRKGDLSWSTPRSREEKLEEGHE
jgi:NADH:ubiquinone oxidoreductase subunit 3 (subunit A)